ncbi:MAG: type II toxin-antitoxin system ParD family antitoxin [Thermodesulfobacteriota bacterium]
MAESVNVRISGKLIKFVRERTGPEGMYESVSEYIRALIRQDYERLEEHRWQRLRGELEPGMSAGESEFVEVSADDVISRNRGKQKS